MDNLDISNAVDYIALDKTEQRIITISERFRERKYSNYTDFTIRYKRDFNIHEERKLSEFFKLDADYFVYGIIDEEKTRVYEARDFIKYCVIDIIKLKALFDAGNIIIDENSSSKRCFIQGEKLICPVINNNDNSSSFFPVDVILLNTLFGDTEVIILQDGFIM